MRTIDRSFSKLGGWGVRLVTLAALLYLAGFIPPSPMAASVTVNVVTSSGPAVGGFYYTVEEDNTYPCTPGVFDPQSMSVSIIRSHTPVVASGTATGPSATINLDSTKRYFISVVPFSGTPASASTAFSQSGTRIAAGQTSATVTVHPTPTPTAQISVLVFRDDASINGAPDVPAEPGLPGFNIILFDQAGQMTMDAFGNPLGTEYDAAGNVMMMGSGILLTDANGEVQIKNIFPGKYGIRAIPPPGDPNWVQTATIEGTPGIDAWVRAAGPALFQEFGFLGWHAFIGFVRPMTAPGGIGTITGQAVRVHEMRPPYAASLYTGEPIGEAWIGLSDLGAGDQQIYAQPAAPDGTFTIAGVPPGTYLLTVWDLPLNQIIDFRTVVVPQAGGVVNMGKVATFSWFGTFEGMVFHDVNGNGFKDPMEMGISDQVVNLRYTDGSIYQSTATDMMGGYSLDQVFPFFHWIVAEVDYTRFKATGATIMVDAGGQPDVPDTQFTAQMQMDPGFEGMHYRIEQAPPPGTLVEGMTLYAGNTNKIDFGKAPYPAGENGGISGIVWNSVTRAEDDPRHATAETWEAGVPRAQVNLYQDIAPSDYIIDDINGVAGIQLADVDNYPLGWEDTPAFKGPEDIDRNGNGTFDLGDALAVTHTDSWDDSPPTGCVPDPTQPPQTISDLRFPGSPSYPIMDCADTMKTWNQIRPAVFDGGYAFMEIPGHPNVPPGVYIVAVDPPVGYEIQKEEDKNVAFGEPPVQNVLPPVCVGDQHDVPHYLSLFPGDGELVYLYLADTDPIVQRPLCDRKRVIVRNGQNTPADFHLLTKAPKAARIWGVVLDDTVLEYRPGSPNMGNNLGVGWLPISIKDYKGKEVTRVYSDQWGRYTGLVPSTYTANPPCPTGISPGMYQICLNDPGPIPDPANPGQFITDPWYNPAYTQNCTTLDFWPGKTTNCDTPILPIASFNSNTSPLDCEAPDHTPLVKQVNGLGTGPYLPAGGGILTITSVGNMVVANPDYDPAVVGSLPTVTRDYGFGNSMGEVFLGTTQLTGLSWSAGSISAPVPPGTQGGQLLVIRGDNLYRSPMAVTVHIGDPDVVHVTPGPNAIQNAIDVATPGRLIIVTPGTYKENVIMWKKVKLQGAGPFVTQIQAGPMTAEEQAAWDAKVAALEASGGIQIIPGEQPNFFLASGAGVMVATAEGVFSPSDPAQIDGIGINMSTVGGGIFVNAFAHYLQISNNRIFGNQGNFGGGIRVGTPSIVCVPDPGPPAHTCTSTYESSLNDNLQIHHNQIFKNGAVDGGGGIALFNGSDNYQVYENLVCGNYSFLYGGGLAHFGLSQNGTIARNIFLNNESFDEGGGLLLAGELVPAGAPAGTLTPGAGSVTVERNLIQGNHGGDDGGGIRLLMLNGQDVQASPTNPSGWHVVTIRNNVVVNNVSADAGAGIALDDSASVTIANNTIARNDSTATGPDAFGSPCIPNVPPGNLCPNPEFPAGGLTTSLPQVAGIASRAHSAGLQAAFGPGFFQEFPNPALYDNIIYQNRSFWWDATFNGGTGGLRPISDIAGATSPYWDLAVYQTAGPQYLDPRYSVLTSTSGYHPSNTAGDPMLKVPYFNVFAATSKGAALGNFVTVTFTPTGRRGDYHIGAGSSAISLGLGTYSNGIDYDGSSRPFGGGYEAGADEFTTVPFADLAISATGSPATVKSGTMATVTYTIQVKNQGPEQGKNVVVSVKIPSTATLLRDASSAEFIYDPVAGAAKCSISKLDGDSPTKLKLAISNKASSAFTSSFSVAAATPSDPDKKNNTTTVTTKVTIR